MGGTNPKRGRGRHRMILSIFTENGKTYRPLGPQRSPQHLLMTFENKEKCP